MAQNYKEAVALYLPAAEKGVEQAQYNLGVMYRDGLGVPSKNDKEALKWFRKAAENGYQKAQFSLGRFYTVGQGVAQDHREAASWYLKAAEQGHAGAQAQLGLYYVLGWGVQENHKFAKDWLVKAAAQGDDLGMLGMGFVAETKTEKYAWFNLSSAFGNTDSRTYRDDLVKTMSTSELAAGQERTRELQKILTDVGVK